MNALLHDFNPLKIINPIIPQLIILFSTTSEKNQNVFFQIEPNIINPFNIIICSKISQ